ncbi:MAG TPA: damage-inducible protein DinB, partial [Pararhizobium sp.]|nr:damage-inducible protein DinB [Pararhizobium sp.]
MIEHYRMFADYNRWANRLLYQAASGLSDAQYREDMGAFFGSLHH